MSFQIRTSTMPLEVSNAKFAETAGNSGEIPDSISIPDGTATIYANTIAILTGSTPTRTLTIDSSSAQIGQTILIKSMSTEASLDLTITGEQIDQGNGTVGSSFRLPEFPRGSALTYVYTHIGWVISGLS